MRLPNVKYKVPKETLIDIRQFRGGSNTLIDEARLSSKYAPQSINLIQVQDGLWKTRWGINYYGQAISGETSISGTAEYIKSNGSREIVAVGGSGKIYKSADNGSTWSEVSGGTLTAGYTPYFLQISSYLYIADGDADLLRYNGSTLAAYSSLTKPANVSPSRGAGLSAGSYTLYYQVTAVNEVGETEGSTEVSITVDKERDTWSAASNEYVDVSWDAVSGASYYQIYYSDESGYEVYLGRSQTNSYRDDNSDTPNPYIEVPDDNTTSAPTFTAMETSGNRIWGTGDPSNKYRVYYSGAGQNLGSFSPFYGGGWVDLEKGGRDTPISVVHYRTGKGDPIATVLCSSPEGLGSIWHDFSFSVPITYKVVGSIGTNAPKSVVKAGDNVFFANKRGIFALRNKQQMFNVLSTDELSQPVRPSYRSFNEGEIEDACAYYYDGKVFFSFAEGDENDIIFIFDLERGNWNYKWTRGVKHFLEYTDTSDTTHFLAVPTSGARLWEISENFSGDFGSPFYQSYLSPLLPVSKDKTALLKLKEALVELGRPQRTSR